MEPISLDHVSEDYRQQVTTQDYTAKPKIEGAQLIELKRFIDDGGSFAELVRFGEGGEIVGIPGFVPRQASYSDLQPGAIKAFHLHFNQEDVWFIPPQDRVLIGLLDTRKDSPTHGVSQRFVMGEGRSQLLYIPRGVAHGGANIWSTPSAIFYFVNQQFNAEQPDEHRLPWDVLGADFWTMTRG